MGFCLLCVRLACIGVIHFRAAHRSWRRIKTIDLPGFLRELAREKANARVTTGAVVVKRRGSADPADWYAVLELSDFTNLLIEAGYGDSISNPKQKESS